MLFNVCLCDSRVFRHLVLDEETKLRSIDHATEIHQQITQASYDAAILQVLETQEMQ